MAAPAVPAVAAPKRRCFARCFDRPVSYIADSALFEEGRAQDAEPLSCGWFLCSKLQLLGRLVANFCCCSPGPVPKLKRTDSGSSFHTALGPAKSERAGSDGGRTSFGTADDGGRPADIDAGAASWFQRTVPQLPASPLPPRQFGGHWARADGLNLDIRAKNYRQAKLKCSSDGNLYECVSFDLVYDQGGRPVERLLENQLLQLPPAIVCTEEISGAPCWAPGCRLPRVLAVYVQLPIGPGATFLKWGKPCCCVVFFELKPETLKLLERPEQEQPPGFRNFLKFVEGPAGIRGDPLDHPNRSLATRRKKRVRRQGDDSGLFKALAALENLDEIVHQFRNIGPVKNLNGKPALITRSGSIVRDPAGEWLEISVKVSKFATAAQYVGHQYRSLPAYALMHVAFTIQGMDDDELPEGIIGDVKVRFVSIESERMRCVDMDAMEREAAGRVL